MPDPAVAPDHGWAANHRARLDDGPSANRHVRPDVRAGHDDAPDAGCQRGCEVRPDLPDRLPDIPDVLEELAVSELVQIEEISRREHAASAPCHGGLD